MTAFEGYPAVSAERMRAIDRLATERFGIPADTLMETAGKKAAERIGELFSNPCGPLACAIICGRGNNGGDGLVAARYLKTAGAEPLVYIVEPNGSYGPLVQENILRAERAGVAVYRLNDAARLRPVFAKADVAVDALLGTGSKGAPQGVFASLVEELNKSAKPIVAFDLPSGLDADTGQTHGVCVRADVTLMFGLPKTGLLNEEARPFTGRLELIDIGFPRELFTSSGQE
jgi:NAD(P)H-hydrate epimerase